MGKYFILLVIILIIATLCSCAKDEPFIIPVNYTGVALIKVHTDKSENTYKTNIICRDGNYSFSIDEGSVSWNVAIFNDNRCILNNENFPESSVTLENFNLSNLIIADFDFSKFNSSMEPIPEELIYWDGTYKHVLNFSKENLLPKTILIYKNDNLVKTILYEEINIE